MYTFRTANKDDLPGIVKLRESVDGGNKYFERSERYYDWKFFNSPCGISIVKIALTKEGEIVGLMSANPKRFVNNGEEVLALEWGDFFTAEKHQHKGVFSSLCRSVLDDIENQEFVFSYIRPNNNSYPIVTSKLGFGDLDELEERFYFINAKKLLQNRLRGIVNMLASPVLDLVFKVIQKQPGLSDNSVMVLDSKQFLGKCIREGLSVDSMKTDFHMIKDHEYLYWRYFESPIPIKCFACLSEDTITDYLFVAFDKLDGVYLMDFMSSTAEGGVKLIDAVLNDMKTMQKKFVTSFVRISNQENDELCKLLKKYKFRKVGDNLHFVKNIHKNFSQEFMNYWKFRLADIDGV